MHVIDITRSYIKHILGSNDLNSYEKSLPELFDHYFTFWANRALFLPVLSRSEVKKKLGLIQEQLYKIEQPLSKAGFPVFDKTIILFVGQNCTNGHAFKYHDDFVVWIPIEAYKTIRQVEIFITHEIIHALHYSISQDFYFGTLSEKKDILRQIVTEGLASLLTMRVMGVDYGGTLWADYIDGDKRNNWLNECEKNMAELCKQLWKGITKAKETHLFEAHDPSNIFAFRGGYYASLKIVEEITQNHSFNNKDILMLSKRDFRELVLETLRKYIVKKNKGVLY